MVPEQKQKVFKLVEKYVRQDDGVSLSHLIQQEVNKSVEATEYTNMVAMLEKRGYKVDKDYYVTEDLDFETKQNEKTKLRFEAITAKWLYYTYWAAFLVSLISLAISILALSRR